MILLRKMLNLIIIFLSILNTKCMYDYFIFVICVCLLIICKIRLYLDKTSLTFKIILYSLTNCLR